jgi:dihydrofolate reductase
MPRVNAGSVSISLDGYMAGPDQDLANPLGVGGMRLHEWIFATASGRQMIGQEGGTQGIDDDKFGRSFDGVGATIMGRNMFGPVRGPWQGDEWRGWWGENPPFGHPVFVLTHFPRADLAVGDTTFVFVTDGVESALDRAREAASGADVHVGGGAATLRAFLARQLIDDLHVAVVPITLGVGEKLVEAAGIWPEGYKCVSEVTGEGATHYELLRTNSV